MWVQVTSSDRPDAPCVPGPVGRTEVVEIDRGDPKENRQKLFAQSWLEQGVGHHHLCFGTDSPAGREPESFLVTKGKDPGAPEWQPSRGKVGGGLTRGGTSSTLGSPRVAFSGWS